jgi:hypothetical protein
MTLVLGPRALNRALLARQMLLERQHLSALEAIDRLVGMQSQVPNAPYVGLWSRVHDFRVAELVSLLETRQAVRTHVMRSTIHLVSAQDGLALRRATQPVMDRAFASGSPFGPALAGIDLAAVLDAGRVFLEEKPRRRADLARFLSARWPDRDPASLSYALTYLVPLVQIPPRGLWGSPAQPVWTTTASWLGRPVPDAASLEDVILRYLAAFGPASVADVRAWSGRGGLRGVVERLRPRLEVVHDERGRELFDVPGGVLPEPETPAPARFLPEYDNVLVAYDDKTRIIPPEHYKWVMRHLGTPMVLVDGFVRGMWQVVQSDPGTTTLRVEPFDAWSAQEHATVTAEGRRLLQFVAPEAAHAVVTTGP